MDHYKIGDYRDFRNYSTPSSGSGFSTNTNPSIVGSAAGARIVWLGTRNIWDEEMQRMSTETKVVFKDPSYPRFWNFGNNVNSPSINGNYNSQFQLTNYIYSWSENSTNYPVKYGDPTLSNVYSAGQYGKDVHTIDGSGTLVLNSHSDLPYLLELKKFIPVKKTDALASKTGRTAVIYRDTCQFYFLAGDIMVNGNPVKFITFPDTASFESLNDMNSCLATESFYLPVNSTFTFSLQGGIIDSADVNGLFTENGWIRFKLELLDAATGLLLGEFSSREYNRDNYELSFSGSYKVNTKNIGNRSVKLRMIISGNIDALYSVADMVSDQSILSKRDFEEISFEGAGPVTEYMLSQNYPNPFNPLTIINYQIPADGSVTLKLFDILGNEVKILVDGYKTSGRYTLEFDASSLASGIYIYRLQAGDFVSSRKMTLLK
jgi:hypothetical protein